MEQVHPAASLYQGWGDKVNMLEGVDASYAGVFLVGYHAGGDNNESVLAHTFCSNVRYIKINGQTITETGLSAWYAGKDNIEVPIALVSGDNNTIREAKTQLVNLGPIIYVAVKESFARDAAISVSLPMAQKLLKDGAAQATTNLKQKLIKPFKVTTPITVEISFYNIGYNVSIYQKLRKTLDFDGKYSFNNEQYTLAYKSNNSDEALATLNLVMQLIFGLRPR
jgi:D-amino peptidase